jgi:hypothetical protein
MLVDTLRLVNGVLSIKGFSELGIPSGYLWNTANTVNMNWSDDWEDGCGFGSSDFTYMIKEVIDDLLYTTEYKTEFNPCLEVVKK